MRICDDLRQAVLQAAIHGKLTKQLPEDGNAADLLNQIAKEKSQLIKEGKIKKEKAVPEVLPDEVPFDIPENWKWCNFNSLFTVYNGDRGKNYPSKATLQTTGDIPFISAINLNGKNVSVDDKLLYVSADQYDKLRAGKLMKNDMVMCIRGSLGKHGRFQFDKGAIASSLVIIRPINEVYVDSDYLSIYLDSPLLFSEIRRFDNGTAQPNLAAESLKKFMFPFPPLAEQLRIVARVDELIARIDDLEKTETELEKLKSAFPGDMKVALLQAAMQGKLTEQLPEDGDAANLLNQIVKEKNQLIKEGKIKKEKPLPTITPDEIPFDIPDNWQWIRLGSIGTWGSGATPSKANINYYKNGTIPWLLTGDLNDGFIDDVPGRITELALKETSVKLNHKGAVLIAMYGATIGKLGIINTELTTNQACCACHPFEGVYNRYLFYFLMYHKPFFIEKAEGGAQPNISREKIVKTLCPLPPLAEQKRIVEKLDKLLPLCDGLIEE